jgi:hypothetical protein
MGDKDMRGVRKINKYVVTRIVEEVYHVDAMGLQEAKDIVTERGDPARVTIVKETVKLKT